ncbi:MULTISPECIES: anti-sigma-F factor Fin family protein [unclassified Virgibacillus]|uniref:anti-sigma-F factor Fin family protein n=1 Tax=unclassified Virgibacillus TaxID=2620237 RepID=UPI0024DEBBE7|nr:anti-sigma-F factor Fin family protein [Virgibacillus sp. LDC-1]
MAIIYTCRHCQDTVGKLAEQYVDTSLLGWDYLTIEEKKEMIHYHSNGDISIQTICESCQETLGQHPQYHELDYFIQ